MRLKELIQGLNYCQKQNKDFTKGHDLLCLWSNFKKAYSSIEENPKDKRFQIVEKLIKEMVSADPSTAAFRYPVDGKGEKIQKLEYVNLTILRETFVRVCFVFDGVAMQVAHYVEMTEEMVQEVYENYR